MTRLYRERARQRKSTRLDLSIRDVEVRNSSINGDKIAPGSINASHFASDIVIPGRTFVSVKDFGAIPSTSETGIVDALPAFQAAVDYVADNVRSTSNAKIGGAVFVNEGMWILSAPIRMKTRVGLYGASRTGSILNAMSGHSGPALIVLDNNLVNFTDIHNLTLNGANKGGVSGIEYLNANDVNSDTIFDIGDAFHVFSNLDVFGCLKGNAIRVHSRATLFNLINIHRCGKGLLIEGSDNKATNIDISWINEEGVIVSGGNNKLMNGKCWYIGCNPPGTSTGDATYFEADGVVIKSNRNTLIGWECQDISRHGVRIDNGDQNQIQGLILDNIGNFRLMQGQGVQHPETTVKSAILLEPNANYNRISFTLAQRSRDPDLQAILNIGDNCSNNYIDMMRDPVQKSVGAPDVIQGTDALDNVIMINGRLYT